MALKLKCLIVAVLVIFSGCMWRVDPMHPLIRSDVLKDEEHVKAIIAKAKLVIAPDGKTRILFLRGSPYERGFQQGYLLRDDIQDNLGYIYRQASSKFHSEELFAESYERMRPFIPTEYIEEMHGLAHGSRLPLHIVHGFHALPTMTEWGGRKHLQELVKKQLWGELSTMCSNFALNGNATADQNFYAVRILDWGLHRISRTHKYPLITVSVPDSGLASVNIGWSGFIGTVSGMNEAGITLGEMGYGNPEGETMRGEPMPFLLRDVMSKAKNLADVRSIISGSPGDCSFIYLMTDGKSRESEMYIRDKDRFLVFKPNQPVIDRNNNVPALKDTLYGGHYLPVMEEILRASHGAVTVEKLQTDLIPKFAMPSNFQNVIYDPVNLKFWVANARNSSERAAEQPYLEFNFGQELAKFRAEMK